MIPSGLFTQIALLALSIGIIFTYIKPTFADISISQEQIGVYQEEIGKVAAVNTDLERKLQQIDNVPQADKERLLTYMPDYVDPLVVMRDLETMSELSGVTLGDITDGGQVEKDSADVSYEDPYLYGDAEGFDPYAVSVDLGPHAYSFSVKVDGSYGQIKELINLMETNNYPLEIRSVDIQTDEGGFLTAEIMVYSYSHKRAVAKDTNLYEDVNVTYE